MDSRSDLPRLIAFNCQVLDQALQVIAAHEAAPDTIFADSSGPHLRHIIEHYQAFTLGVSARSVDYDSRARERSLEQDSALARTRIIALQAELQALDTKTLQDPIAVHLRGGLDGQENFVSFSTIARELLFLSSHAVHHYALIQLHCREQGIDLGPHFGKAPATVQYEQGA